MTRVRLAAALIAVLFAACALAAPFAVQIGEARVGLDTPPGFADTLFTGSPRLQELAEALTSPSNRILLFAISDGDLRKFTQGDPPDFRRYMVAVTPMELERDRVDTKRFAELADAAQRDLGERVPAGRNFTEYFDKQPLGRSSVVAELRHDAEVLSLLLGARVPPNTRMLPPGAQKQQQYALSTSSLVLVRGKTLSLTVYSVYDSAADLNWIRAITARWIDDLQRLNAR
ncbi:MAG TPA: hypothetical protein VGF58_13050 [Burkholderiales bacterium]|jgi:hypothetical protein